MVEELVLVEVELDDELLVVELELVVVVVD